MHPPPSAAGRLRLRSLSSPAGPPRSGNEPLRDPFPQTPITRIGAYSRGWSVLAGSFFSFWVEGQRWSCSQLRSSLFFSSVFSSAPSRPFLHVSLGAAQQLNLILSSDTRGACTRVLVVGTCTVSFDIVWCVLSIPWNSSCLCEEHSVIDLTSTRSILSNTSIRRCTRLILRCATDLTKSRSILSSTTNLTKCEIDSA